MPEHPEAPDRIWTRMKRDVFDTPTWLSRAQAALAKAKAREKGDE